MDQQDVAQVGVDALSGAATAFGPVGGTIALLGLTVGGLLGLHGGSAEAPGPSLTGNQVDQIVTKNLLKQDVRDAWSLISPTYDWYKEWTVRAKSGEQFSNADLNDFDDGYRDATGPNSHLRAGLTKLYAGNPNIDSTPGQFGLPYLILGVGLHVQLLQLGIARTAERGEEVSPGQWQNLVDNLNLWSTGIRDCDNFASMRVQEAARGRMAHDPSLAIGTPAFRAMIRELEIIYRGGDPLDATHDDMVPAWAALTNMVGIIRSVRASGHV